MTYHTRLENSLRWRTVNWLEAGQFQAMGLSDYQVELKLVSWLWNRFQTTFTISRKVNQGQPRAMTSAQNHYLTLKARQLWLLNFLVTLLLCLEEFPSKQFTDDLQRLAFTPVVQSCVSLFLRPT
ncbi:hypothetical protein TNCV_3958931 [Trichonephila clavipes]|nr:hypothetical protein TNCV_3958931 [Trichonephila clavipes]